MTRHNYSPGSKADHSSYGGEITVEDFNTYLPNKNRIRNQIDAINLYETMKQIHYKEQKYKNMTLEDLRELKLISNTDGRPASSMTDEKWQKEFNLRKMFITPYPKDFIKLKGKYANESAIWDEEIHGVYCGCTAWQSYCSYINDILLNIRSGQIDYCYYIYQILDIARFHLNDLRTKYCNGYWEVWLER